MRATVCRGFLCVLGSLACATGAFAQHDAPFRFETTPGQLPKTALPRAYRIELRPDVAAATFTATEEIDVNVAVPTDTIVVNAVDLTFDSVVDVQSPGQPAAVSVDAAAQTATLRLGTRLGVGLHTLRVQYHGPITAQPAGLYYNDYGTGRHRRRMLVTQFEPTDARRMFPGWDEPAFKATFTLSVVIPRDQVALSNTPVRTERPAGVDRHGRALKEVTFETTPSMSTYLVALAAGDLKAVRGEAAGVRIASWAVAGKESQGRAALSDAAELLPYYNDYFGVDYPLPKLDLLAVPGNFDAGAMENWGLITFIDDSLLFDPAASSESTRRDIYETVAHEMAHQWSGDLVTMAWWDNLWLNEGFAAWMEAKATDHFRPEWNVWLDALSGKERAMTSDARSTSHPVQARVVNDSDVLTLFDDITYQKGSQLIRMIETYVGEDAFRRGMRSYMKRHAYSNATTADLWAELEAASGRPVGSIAATFTEQPGLPLVRVDARCEAGRTRVTLSQRRFTLHDATAAPLTWQIPVRLGFAGSAVAPTEVLLGAAPAAVEIDGCAAPVKANLGDVGYYRVDYDPATRAALSARLATLSPADRVNLLGDEWALVTAGDADAGDYLGLLSQLTDEREVVVWDQVTGALLQIDALLYGRPEREAFRARARALLGIPFARLGWEPKPGEPGDHVLLRGSLIDALGTLGDAAVLSESRTRFDHFVAEPRSLDPSLRDAVASNVGRRADAATFARLHALGKSAGGTEERLRYYRALAAAQDPSLLKPLIAILLTDEVSPARVATVLATAAAEGPDPEAVWRAALRVKGPLLDKLSVDQRERVLPRVASATSNPRIAEELLALPESNATTGATYEARRAAERIATRAEQRERLVPAIGAWLGLPQPAPAPGAVR